MSIPNLQKRPLGVPPSQHLTQDDIHAIRLCLEQNLLVNKQLLPILDKLDVKVTIAKARTMRAHPLVRWVKNHLPERRT